MWRVRIPPRQRARDRASVDPLKQSLIKKSTLQSYLNALRLFCLWLRFWHIPWPGDGDDLDQRVCEFGESAWEEGESRSVFAFLVSGIRYFEESLHYNLFAARRLIGAWDKAERVFRSFPITPLMAEALAGEALCNGWLLEAVAILVSTAGMFRVMEFLSLTAAQVSGSLEDEAVVITLRDTKTSNRKQLAQHAFVRDPVPAALLLYLKSGLLAGDKIFKSLSPKVLRDHLRRLAVQLKLQDLLIAPHSFRCGGATQRFRETGSFHVVAEEADGNTCPPAASMWIAQWQS